MSQTGTIAITIVVIVALVAAVFLIRARAQSRPPQGKADPAKYQVLRNQALGWSRTALGLPAPSVPTEPWGVVMDISFEDGGSYTIVAVADGNASIYLSSGGGFIGGIGHESVRTAAKAMVAAAKTFQPKTTLTTSFPLPKAGDTAFYLLTDSGVFTTSASEEALGEKRHELHPLFYAGQEVVTQYRLIDERKR